MSTIDHTSAIIMRVLAEHELTKHEPALSVMDLADKIAATIRQDAPANERACPPDHPQRLEGEAAYAAAPLGTIARTGANTTTKAITKTPTGWITTDGVSRLWPHSARAVIRWGYSPGWEPGTDVSDRMGEAPEGVIVQDRNGNYWHSDADGWLPWPGAGVGWDAVPETPVTLSDLSPLVVATSEQIAAARVPQGEN